MIIAQLVKKFVKLVAKLANVFQTFHPTKFSLRPKNPPISIKLVPTGDGHKQPLYTTPKFNVADISMMSVLDYGSSHVSEVNIPGLLTQFGIDAGCKRPGKRATLVFQSN